MEEEVKDLKPETNEELFIDLLQSTERENINSLIEEMKFIGFFETSCSGGNHLCKVGGLVEHSLNVIKTAMKLAVTLDYQDMNSVIIAAALHDLGKCGDYEKPYYIKNMIKDGKPTKANPEQKYKVSESKPFKRNSCLLEMNHAIKSVVLATRFIDLTEDEEYAILHHDGLYEMANREAMSKPTQLLLIIHYADLWSARFIEHENYIKGEDE